MDNNSPDYTASTYYLIGRHLAILIFLSGWLFFWRLGEPGLMDPDEGRYAEIAREILLLKDWLIPHLNLLPYLEKPPLVYWLTALNMAGFGLTEWAARLAPALSAVGGIIWAYLFGQALWGPGAAFRGALVLATSMGYVIMGRILTLDMTLAFFMDLGIGLGYLALSRGRRDLWPWAYLALSLAVLTKGPVALALAGLIWVTWALLEKRPLLRPFCHPLGLLILAGITLPWFLYVTWRYPEFLRFFLWDQHLGRFLTASIHHQEPFYYYIPVLLGLMLPWGCLLPWVLTRLMMTARGERLFLVIWAGIILLFFSLSRGKLAPYILPAVLPLALLVGDSLQQLQGRIKSLESSRGLLLTLVVWGVLAGVLAALFFWPPTPLKPLVGKASMLAPAPLIGLIMLALMPVLTLIINRPSILFAGALLLCVLVPLGIERISTQRSPRDLAAVLTSHQTQEAPLIGVKLYSQGLSFYSRKPFHLLDFPTELDFGRRLVPASGYFFSQPRDMANFAGAQSLVFFYLKEKSYSRLRQWLTGDFQPLGHHRDCLLLSYRGK